MTSEEAKEVLKNHKIVAGREYDDAYLELMRIVNTLLQDNEEKDAKIGKLEWAIDYAKTGEKDLLRQIGERDQKIEELAKELEKTIKIGEEIDNNARDMQWDKHELINKLKRRYRKI